MLAGWLGKWPQVFPKIVPLMERYIDRRDVLRLGVLASVATLLPGPVLAAGRYRSPVEKRLSLYNAHTRERLETVYRSQGLYVPTALHDIDHILRDHRTGEVKPIDPRLLDLLYAIQKRLAADGPFHVISGYRSPVTNAYLSRCGRGVARNSLHMQGKAADVCLPGRDLSVLRRVAMELQCGGVGYYPRPGFVHVDVGQVRAW